MLIVRVPDINKKYELIHYFFSGTWLMESNSDSLNAWKLKIPNGNYLIVGAIESTDGNFALKKFRGGLLK